MKIFKKILVLICVLAFITVGVAVAALAENENVGSVEELEKLYATADAAETPDVKYNAIQKIAEYLNTKTVDPEEDGYDELMTNIYDVTVSCALDFIRLLESAEEDKLAEEAYAILPLAHELLELFEYPDDTNDIDYVKTKYDEVLVTGVAALIDEIDADIASTKTTAKNGVAVRKVKRIITECAPFGNEDDLKDLNAEFSELVALHDAAVAANYEAADEANYISNYDLPIYLNQDWNKRDVSWGGGSSLGDGWNVNYNGAKNLVGIQAEPNGNKYYAHRYLDASENVKGSSFIQASFKEGKIFPEFTSEYGIVIEFDVTTFSEFPEFGLLLETGSINGGAFPPAFLYIDGKGDIYAGNKSTLLLPGAIVKGQWTRIVIALDPETFMYTIFVDGEKLGESDAKLSTGMTYDHKDVALRFSSGNKSSYGEIAIDNLLVYGGNTYRNHDRLAKMSDNDKFLLYVDYLLNDGNPVLERCNAYNLAEELLPKYWIVDEKTGEGQYTDFSKNNIKIKAAIEKFNAFDLEAFLKEVGLANLEAYVNLIKKLDAVDRSPSSVTERQKLIADIDKFVDKNIELTDRDADMDGNNNSDYTEYNLIYQRLVIETDYDYNAPTFIRSMQRFDASETLSAKERNYNNAKKLIDAGVIDIDLIHNESNPDREKFADLIEAYELFLEADAEILKLAKVNNSQKIVYCMNMISKYNNESQWLENEELMLEYLYLIKDIVRGDDGEGGLLYDESYVGVKTSVEFFNRAFGFFFARMQVEHVEYIQNVLDLVLSTDKYIEKMGMLALLDKYIAEEDVDLENDKIQALIEDIDTCKAELKLREEDYANVLRQNAIYFTNIVERMRTADNYYEQKQYYDEATLLYFNLDATVGDTARAIEIYDEYKVKIETIEECSIRFNQSVSLYNACETDEDKYAALVECYYNAQYAELTYEGVEESMAEYKAAYDAYMSYAESVNSDVAASGNAVGSFRANLGIINVVSLIIEMIFGK